MDGAFDVREAQQIRTAIKGKYQKVSQTAEGLFRYETGKPGAVFLGYDRTLLGEIPDDAMQSFCGVGNPCSIQEIKPENSVLDIGCGAGFDCIVASGIVGPEGMVCGIDLTEEMVRKAESLVAEFAAGPITIMHVPDESIPFDDNTFDHVISNGVFNLSPFKYQLFKEIRRVLKPDGNLQFADIVLAPDIVPKTASTLDDWAQ